MSSPTEQLRLDGQKLPEYITVLLDQPCVKHQHPYAKNANLSDIPMTQIREATSLHHNRDKTGFKRSQHPQSLEQ